MPIPEPRPSEDQQDFVQRCMADDVMNKEFADPKQRLSVCYAQWTKKM
jgi:hypothetical protein